MKNFLRWLLIGFVSGLGPTAQAFEIPRQLSSEDRRDVVRILGMNSATKILSNPYPLGGYSGLEVGYSVEFVNVRDLRRLGCTPGALGCVNTRQSTENEWRYSRLTIGKGLYNDVDLFLHFIPPTGGVGVSDYGGAVRWSFFQAQFLPISASVLLHGNQLNLANDFINRNVGTELILGVNVNNFALYFGAGVVQATGTFLGGNSGNGTVDPADTDLNPNSNTATYAVQENHSVVGFCLHHENLFAAAQVDRYDDAVYSMKIGVRF